MKAFTKVLSGAVIFSLMVSFTACSDGDGKDKPNPTESAIASASPTAAAQTTPLGKAHSKLTELLEKSEGLDNYAYTYTVVTAKETSSYDIYVKGSKRKVYSEGVTTYIDYEKNEAYEVIDSDTKATKINMVNPSNESDPFKAVEAFGIPRFTEHVGEEKVDGKDCLVFRANNYGAKMSLYIWKEHGIPLKAGIHSSVDDKMQTTFTYTDMKVGEVTDEMVTVPNDLEVVEKQ